MRRNRRRDRQGEAHFQPLYTEQDGLKAWRRPRPTRCANGLNPRPAFACVLERRAHPRLGLGRNRGG
jgi:metallo-beta-lactamase family protein